MKRSTKDGPWAWINIEALEGVARLGGDCVAVYVALAAMESRDTKKAAFFSASREQVAKACGKSVRTITRCIDALAESGFIDVKSGRNLGGNQVSNRYSLLSLLWATQSRCGRTDSPSAEGLTGTRLGTHSPAVCGTGSPTLKKERNIEPGASGPRDSIKKETAENVVAFPAPNSAAEEELSESMKEIMRFEADDRRRAAEKLAAGPSPEELERRRKFLESRVL